MRERHVLLAAWVLFAVVWSAFGVALLLRIPVGGSDFSIFLAAGQALRFNQHADIYQLDVLRSTLNAHGGCDIWGTGCTYSCNIWGLPYVYPPLLAILLMPLSALSCANAWFVWQLINFGFWALCVVMLVWPELEKHPRRALVIAFLSVTFLPLLQGLLIGQVNIIVLTCCLLASFLVQRNRPFAAGSVLAVGALLKYFPAFLILYYLLRGRWRVALSAAFVGAGIVAAQIAVVGPQLFLKSFTAGAHEIGAESHGLWVSALPGGALLAVIAIGGFAGSMLMFGRTRDGDERLGMSWALCTMLLLSPWVPWLYLTWILPAFAACFSASLNVLAPRTQRRSLAPLALVGLAYLLVMVRMAVTRLTDPAAIIATVILWALCGIFFLQSAGAVLIFKNRVSASPRHGAAAQATIPSSAR